MITACFAHALQRCTSRIGVHFLLIFQEAILISKTRNQLYEKLIGLPLNPGECDIFLKTPQEVYKLIPNASTASASVCWSGFTYRQI